MPDPQVLDKESTPLPVPLGASLTDFHKNMLTFLFHYYDIHALLNLLIGALERFELIK